ncbi:uncharacterized protein TM35_000142700 [Trypanosoma theileri]|uniref:Leucine-rich domain-containing protein n=1 Tax=Trypanosoma theileri TaxID=67003 RepID=A0A1X0NXV6_9TRYP|nr:uncharacterized protein TM35_000142700 [Trypanosoma theileri]ORC89059.1 hypothetical protein TM35_000142700 [Trypanosoma theileri]
MGCNGSRPKAAVKDQNKNKKSSNNNNNNNNNNTRVDSSPASPLPPGSPVVVTTTGGPKILRTSAAAAAAAAAAARGGGGRVRGRGPQPGTEGDGTASRPHSSSSVDSRTKPPQSSASSKSDATDAVAQASAPRPYQEPFSAEPVQEHEVSTASPLPLVVYNEQGNYKRNNCSFSNGNRESNRSSNRYDNDYMTESFNSSFSSPQLFRISPTQRAQRGEGTWEWWYEQVDKLRITKDCSCRARLEDIQNRLARQYDTDKGRVELDLGWCYMERSAPYVLGRLFASPFIAEIRWITALRLDGNYFTDEGFGNMLAVMSVANESKIVLPLLKQLYLNNMNLDPNSIHGILYYLFPLKPPRALIEETNTLRPSRSLPVMSAVRGPTIAGESIGFPLRAYIPFDNSPHTPLFPSLEVLSLCDNPGIGNRGLAVLLRCLIAPHYERRELPVLDLSRCGIDEVGGRYLREYLTHLRISRKNDENLVALRRVVLIGNRHSMDRAQSICSNDDSHYQSNDYDNNNINNKNNMYTMRKQSGSHHDGYLQNGNDDDASSRDRDVSIVL